MTNTSISAEASSRTLLQSAISRRPGPTLLHFITPVWNDEYVERYLEFSLPSQLAEGNIPALAPDRCLYQVFTRPVDKRRLIASPIFHELQSLVPVDIRTFDDLPLDNPYFAMSQCYERGIRTSAGVDAAFVFLTPDVVCSAGTFAAVDRLGCLGKRAILSAGLRMTLDQGGRDLLRFARGERRHDLSISSRDLVGVCVRNLHPLSIAHLCTGRANRSVGHYYWDVAGKGLLARCFHVHPLMVWPESTGARLVTTLDHEYVRQSCPDKETVHLVVDSDEIMLAELSKAEHQSEMISNGYLAVEEIVEWMTLWTNEYHRGFVRCPIYFHADDLSSDWDEYVKKSDGLVDALFEAYLRQGLPVDHVGKGIFTQSGNEIGTMSPPEPPRAERRASCTRMIKRLIPSPIKSGVKRVLKRVAPTVLELLDSRISKLESAVNESKAQLQAIDWQRHFDHRKLQEVGDSARILAQSQHRDVARDLTENKVLDELQPLMPGDPTVDPPLGYTSVPRALSVYATAFQRAFEYLLGTEVSGPILEFGTYRGFTARVLAHLMILNNIEAPLHLFDSFSGFPETSPGDIASYETSVRAVWTPGAASVDADVPKQIESVLRILLPPENVHVVKGFYADTLDEHLPTEKCSLVNIDCDLYSSAREVLLALFDRDLLQDGSVILFDDFNCNRANPRMGERRALAETMEKHQRWRVTPFFSYGWHGKAFFLHDTAAFSSLDVDRLSA